MVLLFSGTTACGICGRVIEAADDAKGFPAFVGNRADPLYFFSDAAFHATCFHRHPLASAAEARFLEVRRKGPPSNRRCSICGLGIDSPDDYFGLGHLTNDSNEPVYSLNYLQAHRSCLPTSPELETTRRTVQEFIDSGRWEGPGLSWMLGELPASSKLEG